MRNRTLRTLALILVVVLFPFLGHSQTKELQQKVKGFKNNKRFAVTYDKFKDISIVSVVFVTSGTARLMVTGSMYLMEASFGFRGQELNSSVDTFYLAFDHTGKEWDFLRNRDLYLIIDGERVSFSDGHHDGKVGGGGISERLLFEIPRDTFTKIATAKSVELRVGSYQTKLKDEHLQAFRDLMSLTK